MQILAGPSGASTATPANTRIQDGAAATLGTVTATPADAVVNANSNPLNVLGFPLAFNGTTWDRVRSAAAAVLAAFSSVGAQLVALPGQWTATSNPAAGTAASASRAAGAAGVRHVLTGYTITLSATTALAGITTVTINIRDGATGAGAVLAAITMTLPAATLLPTTISRSGLNIPGTAATAMTVEGSAAVGNLMESISLEGYDAS